jgi:recombination protein RecT
MNQSQRLQNRIQTSQENKLRRSEESAAIERFSTMLKNWVNTAGGKSILSVLGGQEEVKKYIGLAIAEVSTTPMLIDASFESLCVALQKSAKMRLLPGVDGHLLPYQGRVEFVPNYQGIIKQVMRGGFIRRINAEIVYQKDQFAIELGLDRNLSHKPAPLPISERGERVGAYVVFETGFRVRDFFYMSAAEIYFIKEKYTRKTSFSPWYQNNVHAENWMWKKTVLKQASKLWPKDVELASILAADIEAEKRAGILEPLSGEIAPVVDTTTGEIKPLQIPRQEQPSIDVSQLSSSTEKITTGGSREQEKTTAKGRQGNASSSQSVS